MGQHMAKFDYSAYYRRLQDLKKLQIPAESVCWTEQYRPPDRTYDVVLYLGCNILRTPDVAADVVAEVKYDVISSIWRVVLFGPAH